MLKEVIQKLRGSIFILAEREESNLLSFWAGYFESKPDEYKEITNLIGNYLNQNYGIENNLTTWIEQIDHYSFIKKVDWFDGFYKLLAEIFHNEDEINRGVKQKIEVILIDNKISVEVLDEVEIKGEIKIRKGDILKLSDKIGKDYKQTKHYDINLKNPSWDLFYPSKKDFKHIRFLHRTQDKQIKDCTYGLVWRIFSNFPTRVQTIELRKGKYFINTDIFEIELEGALKEQEFTISSEKGIPKNFLSLIEDFNNRIEHYRLGLITEDGFNLSQFIAYNLTDFNMDWQNFRRHFSSKIGQNWCEVNKRK